MTAERKMVQGYYAILDVKESSIPKVTLLSRAERLLEGEPCCLQLRAKRMSDDDLVVAARLLAPLCQHRSVLFCINDRWDVAWITQADMVHLGQEDLSLHEARRLRGSSPWPRIGVSTHDLAQARSAAADGADYIGFGPVFSTQSKAGAGQARGLDALAEIVHSVTLPVVAIGGICLENVAEVVRAGAQAAAVIAAVETSPDPGAVGRAMGAAFKLSRPTRT